MKIKRLSIFNIGLIEDMTIEPNAPLNIFYGEIRQGKTTILNAVKLCFGGAFPSDIIKHGKDEAKVEIVFDDASIRRSFYRNKSGETVARSIEFIKDGVLIQKPVDEIKKLLNPFLLDHEHLQRMSETERKKYFTELFDIDTEELDIEYQKLEENNKEIRAVIKGYGEINLESIEKIDIEVLRKERDDAVTLIYKKEDEISEKNKPAKVINTERVRISYDIKELEEKIELLTAQVHVKKKWLLDNPEQNIEPLPERLDTSEIDEKINIAVANNVKYEQYLVDEKRVSEKDEYERTLKIQETRQRDIRKEKVAKLQAINTGIKDLEFDEEGNIMYQGTFAGMMSTSQVLKLSTELSSLYPEGFGLSLIDRGESLGKSIFGFIEEAKRDNKTILATVVGEKCADIPEDVGVYVVSDGRITENTPL